MFWSDEILKSKTNGSWKLSYQTLFDTDIYIWSSGFMVGNGLITPYWSAQGEKTVKPKSNEGLKKTLRNTSCSENKRESVECFRARNIFGYNDNEPRRIKASHAHSKENGQRCVWYYADKLHSSKSWKCTDQESALSWRRHAICPKENNQK